MILEEFEAKIEDAIEAKNMMQHLPTVFTTAQREQIESESLRHKRIEEEQRQERTGEENRKSEEEKKEDNLQMNLSQGQVANSKKGMVLCQLEIKLVGNS